MVTKDYFFRRCKCSPLLIFGQCFFFRQNSCGFKKFGNLVRWNLLKHPNAIDSDKKTLTSFVSAQFWNTDFSMWEFFLGWGFEELFLRRSLCDLLRSKMCFWSLVMMFQTDWDMFETVLTPLSHENRFFIAKFFDKNFRFWRFQGFYKHFPLL